MKKLDYWVPFLYVKFLASKPLIIRIIASKNLKFKYIILL